MNPGSPSAFTIIRRFGREANKFANELCDVHLRLVYAREQLKFNLRCKRNNIVPKSLRFRPPIRTPQGFAIANATSKRYLRAFIAENHSRINYFSALIPDIQNRLALIVPQDLQHCLQREINQKMLRKTTTIREKLINKFNSLINYNQSEPNKKLIKNISTRQLTSIEVKVLEKGLNFAIQHKNIDCVNLIASVDPAIDYLRINPEEKILLKQSVANAIQNAPKHNYLTLEEKRAVKSLQDDQSIIIVKADKGNAVVVIDTVDYEHKIAVHLADDETYRPIQTNPLKTLQNKINFELKKLKDTGLISENGYKTMRARTATIPRFYALIKTHKENNPIRPIVSFIGSPTYELAKFLSNLLMPTANKNPRKLKNTLEVKNTLRDQLIPPNYSLVSFDVKNLFTCIPHVLAVDSITEALENDAELIERTPLQKNEIIKLIKLCLQSTTFQWRNNLYQQITGTPMGSPISVVIAELTMQIF